MGWLAALANICIVVGVMYVASITIALLSALLVEGDLLTLALSLNYVTFAAVHFVLAGIIVKRRRLLFFERGAG